MRVVATAGHVDHGKSTLVHAITGMDPDRFAEEKARGLTIDLGFAWTGDIAFVDVPGHVRFIKNMLAGVGAVEACLFVVAATEGWKPQSEEHLRILQLLGVKDGVIALTKVGLVDDEWQELAALDVAERVAGTFLEGADIVPVDAPALKGLEQLLESLKRMLSRLPAPADQGRPRLWVDRAFAAKGSGTVVTGTLAGGSLRVEDEVLLVPSGSVARVRALQSHKSSVEEATPGRRLAVNLAGVAHHEVRRGDAVVMPKQWEPTKTVDVSLTVLESVEHEVSRRGAYVLYAGSGEHAVKMRLLRTPGTARLHLPTALPLRPGDRFVLRESGRGETIGGGEVLDVAPVLPASKAAPDRSVERVVRERGWVDADVLERLTGERVEPNLSRWVVDPAALEAARERVRSLVGDAGPAGLDVAVLDERDRLVLADLGVEVRDGRAGGSTTAAEDHPFVAALEASPFAPPPPDTVDRAELRQLVQRGVVVERDGIYFAASAADDAARVVAKLLKDKPDGVTASEVREALGTSRKYLLPLLAHLDATGVTRRRGDVRISGPRLPAT